mgnify:CR=1 FL=1
MSQEALKERIEELEKELTTTKVNKRTEASVGLLKAKIARLKEELEQKSAKGGRGEGYAVRKEGDSTVGLLGKPSVGKSTLLSKITNKDSKIGAYEFTTLEVIPGLLNHRFTNLQVLDLPGIIKGAAGNKGFGKKVLSVVRACDLVVFVINAKHIDEMDMLLEEISKAGIRVNKTKPFIQISKKPKGGIVIPINQSEENIPEDLIRNIMNDNKIVNAEVLIHEENLTVEDLIDAVYGNLVYTKGIICLNKIDLCKKEEIVQAKKLLERKYPGYDLYGISSEKEINLEGFKDFVWDNLGFIWVYLKEQREEPDMERPLVLRKGDTVEDLCSKIHKDFLKKFKYAKVKGPSAKFEWQRIGLDHKVEHGDIVEVYAR